MTRRVLGVLAMAAVLIGPAGCTSSGVSAPSSTPRPSSPSTTAAPTTAANGDLDALGLPGTYTTTIPTGADAAPGEWELTIGSDGLTARHPDGHTFNPGDVLEASADEIVLAADPACPDQDEPTDGRYRWSVDGEKLTFELVSDSCSGRVDTLTSSDWSLRH